MLLEKLQERLKTLKKHIADGEMFDPGNGCTSVGFDCAILREIEFLESIMPNIPEFKVGQKIRLKHDVKFYAFKAKKGATGVIDKINEKHICVKLDEFHPDLRFFNNCIFWEIKFSDAQRFAQDVELI